jgi:predicted RNA-binding protein with PUA-like domain
MPTPARQYWLVKSEPDVFSFDDLVASPKQTTTWDGVRNYAARNHLRAMKKGDQVLFYHSSTKPQAIVGIAEVVREAYPDPADGEWSAVDLRGVDKLKRAVTLEEIKKKKGLETMALLRIGRLSVQPVTPKEFETIISMSS